MNTTPGRAPMTKEDAEKIYGEIVFLGKEHIVRVIDGKDRIVVNVHKYDGTHEELPQGYFLGSNRLESERK